jgi:HSP20 family protein
MQHNDSRERKLARYEPARYLSPVREMMERFFDDDFFRFPTVPTSMLLGARATLFPKVDISETEKDIIVTANVPGVSAENLSIEVDDDTLTISGKVEKESKEGKEGETFYRYEREYGEFRREFALPSRVNKDAVEATTRNGVLRVVLPKIASESRKKIEVKED